MPRRACRIATSKRRAPDHARVPIRSAFRTRGISGISGISTMMNQAMSESVRAAATCTAGGGHPSPCAARTIESFASAANRPVPLCA
ncbi:hypothetical protein D8O27_17205 [Burkholderia mallei]|uniref:Uncharacterized protein n=2 Tax=Burkholderia mallei TaxID=13373 RepID=A0AAX1XB93_BURML|nr:hypothetical protein BMAA1321 [Burkholderia mallei ATCC 23344]AYX04475.1 hypothetical protein EGY14_12195 [Burkholderia pseudomallei]RKN96108.1 hypothetical protein D8O31_18270 [Burkholderia mallei]MBM5591541.1 hypothetical protein [Burkholderia pseudomallei]MBM5624632.1 hypothetical protein [Burkholderia pseudomallei]